MASDPHVRCPAQVSICPQNLAFCLGLSDHGRKNDLNNDKKERAPHGRAVRRTKNRRPRRRKHHVDCQTYRTIGGSRLCPARQSGHGRRPGAADQDHRLRRHVGGGALVRHQLQGRARGRRRSDQQGGRRDAGRRRQGQDRHRLPRRPLQRGGGHLGAAPHRLRRGAGGHRSHLLQRRRAAVRRPAEEGGGRRRHRPAVPGLHRRRHQDRARQDLRMGVPQRAQRERRCTRRSSGG